MSCAPDAAPSARWGRWAPGSDPDVVMMICTAGHVDHGKTRLVKLLTGCETDRLREEQERGMTIELGFAPCRLGDDFAVGIVDVPGHERFVRNMVAGVSGIEMGILVVAADDGVMPQTVEHVQIMELLGVGSAVAAVTKTDRVGADRVEAVTREVRDLLAETPFRSAPVCPVSSETIEGFAAFRDALDAQARAVARRRSRGVFRMPVERWFSLAGRGLVLSGIPVAGSIAVGDEIEAVPGSRRGRVRGIQRFGRDAPSGGFGQCLALNVPEWSRHVPDRGCVVALPGYLQPVLQLHLDLRTVIDLVPPLRNAERIMFHAGTSEVSGKIYLLEGKELAAGRSAPATVVLDAPVGVARHDRFLVRRPSPARTVGGGVILDVAADRRRQPRARTLERLDAVSRFFRTDRPDAEAWPRKACEFFLREDAVADATLAEIAFAALLPGETAREAVAGLVRDGTVIDLGRERFVHAGRYDRIRSEVMARIRDARMRAGSLAVAREDLRGGRPGSAPLWNRLFDELEREGLLRTDAARVVLVERSDEVQRTQGDLVERVTRVFAETGFHAPRPDELPALLHADPNDVARVVEHLCLDGALFRLAKNVILDKDHLRTAQERVVDIIQCNGSLDSGEFKHAIESSRKYALAVLDWLDARGVTLRQGNLRTLAPRFRERMI